ncbi:MAG: PepSY domain-containing protein [Chloracidobacterium sp.]|nr:PepSY domain-containing protein [Chloracidobacterium sp.]
MITPVRRSRKPVLRSLHSWVGLIAGAFLVIIGLTGSVIVFRNELERVAAPRGMGATAANQIVNLDVVAGEITQMRPGARIRRVRLPSEGEPLVVQVESDNKLTERIVIDSASGQFLGTMSSRWVNWMIDLHRNLLTGKQGRKAVGFAGVILFALSISGVALWITGPRKWRSWVLVRRNSPSRRFHFELHRATGLWAFSLLAVISFTGIELSFPNTFRGALISMTGEPGSVKAPRRGSAGSLRPLEEYISVGRAAMPDGSPVEIRLPENAKGVVDLRFHRHGDLAPDGNHVYLEPSSASVLMVDRLSARPLTARFLAAMSPIHYGEFGGIPIKTLWAILGLLPSLLFFTGFVVWRRPVRRKSSQSAPGPEPELELEPEASEIAPLSVKS